MSPRNKHDFKAARRGAVVVEFAVTSGSHSSFSSLPWSLVESR